MSDTFAKLASKIVTSTVWMLDDHTRLVWLTMLAIKDKDHIVTASIPGLANIARVPVDSCRKAIEILSSPDEDSGTKEDDGRRIMPVENGWYIINGEKYRWFGVKEEKREQARLRVAKFREKQKALQTVTCNNSLRQISQAEAEADKSTPSSPPKGGRKYKKETDDEFIQSLQAKECYQGIDVRLQLQRMTTWCETNGQQPSRRRFVNWLNRCDKPLRSTPVNKRNVGVAGGDQAVQMGLMAQKKVDRIQEEEMRKMKELEARGQL